MRRRLSRLLECSQVVAANFPQRGGGGVSQGALWPRLQGHTPSLPLPSIHESVKGMASKPHILKSYRKICDHGVPPWYLRVGVTGRSRNSPVRTGGRTGWRAEPELDVVLCGGPGGLAQCLCCPNRTCAISSSPLTSGTM